MTGVFSLESCDPVQASRLREILLEAVRGNASPRAIDVTIVEILLGDATAPKYERATFDRQIASQLDQFLIDCNSLLKQVNRLRDEIERRSEAAATIGLQEQLRRLMGDILEDVEPTQLVADTAAGNEITERLCADLRCFADAITASIRDAKSAAGRDLGHRPPVVPAHRVATSVALFMREVDGHLPRMWEDKSRPGAYARALQDTLDLLGIRAQAESIGPAVLKSLRGLG